MGDFMDTEERAEENTEAKETEQANLTAQKIKETAKKVSKKKVSLGTIFIIVILLAIFVAFVMPAIARKDGEQVINTESTLENVIKTSSLSTYETVYNGVAAKMDEKNEKVQYYVSYTATVKAGLDFNKIGVNVNEEQQKVTVTLPPITLQEPTVAIEDLDYIFVKKHYKEQGVVAEAYALCIDDVREESKKQKSIYKYAFQNAQNLIKGLLSPFVEQLDGNYTIEFKEGK